MPYAQLQPDKKGQLAYAADVRAASAAIHRSSAARLGVMGNLGG